MPREVREQDGAAYSQKESAKHDFLSPFVFQVYFWMFAFVHEEILRIYVERECGQKAAVKYKFAQRMTVALGKSDWARAVRDSFSETMQKVIFPAALVRNLKHFMESKAPQNHQNSWGFTGLYGRDIVDDLERVCAVAVNIFATVVSDLPVFGALGVVST